MLPSGDNSDTSDLRIGYRAIRSSIFKLLDMRQHGLAFATQHAGSFYACCLIITLF
jgi:hypothetical protein